MKFLSKKFVLCILQKYSRIILAWKAFGKLYHSHCNKTKEFEENFDYCCCSINFFPTSGENGCARLEAHRWTEKTRETDRDGQ